MFPKTNPVQSETYRRLVASLPCADCGIEGYSQCAHGPTLGLGIKCSDLETFPLCCTRPGQRGCHELYDRYEWPAEQRAILGEKWAAETRATVKALGLWPKKLQELEKV